MNDKKEQNEEQMARASCPYSANDEPEKAMNWLLDFDMAKNPDLLWGGPFDHEQECEVEG